MGYLSENQEPILSLIFSIQNHRPKRETILTNARPVLSPAESRKRKTDGTW